MHEQRLILAALALFTVSENSFSADVSYLGRGAAPGTAIVLDSEHGSRQIREGETLPGLGELRTIADDELVFERELGNEERAALVAGGAVVPDIQRRHLYRHAPGAAEAGAGAATTLHGD